MAGTAFVAGVTSIASENVIVRLPAVRLSPDETNVGGVSSGGVCANAYPSSGANAARSGINPVSSADWYGTIVCPGSPACSMAPAASAITSAAASTRKTVPRKVPECGAGVPFTKRRNLLP